MSGVRMCRAVRIVVKAVRDLCDELGVPRPELRAGGKHLKLVFTFEDGRERVSPLACWPVSAEAVAREKVRDVRRMLREEGVIV